MDGFLQDVGKYLIQVVFGIYILTVMLRFLFQLVRADFYNPLSQAIVKLTNPPLLPLRRVIPGLGGIDMASVVLMLALQVLENSLLVWISGIPINILGVLIVAIAQLLRLAVYIFMVALIVRIVLSWVSPYGGHGNPVVSIIVSLTEPMMRPARRLIPPIGGLDLSPIVIFVVLNIILMFLNRLFGI